MKARRGKKGGTATNFFSNIVKGATAKKQKAEANDTTSRPSNFKAGTTVVVTESTGFTAAQPNQVMPSTSLDMSPKRNPKYSDNLNQHFREAQGGRFGAKRFQGFDEDNGEREPQYVDDQPFNLAASETQNNSLQISPNKFKVQEASQRVLIHHEESKSNHNNVNGGKPAQINVARLEPDELTLPKPWQQQRRQQVYTAIQESVVADSSPTPVRPDDSNLSTQHNPFEQVHPSPMLPSETLLLNDKGEPQGIIAGQGGVQGHGVQGRCKLCGKLTMMQSVCGDCNMQPFNDFYEQFHKQQEHLLRLNHQASSFESYPDPTPASVQRAPTDFGIGHSGALSSQDGSHMRRYEGRTPDVQPFVASAIAQLEMEAITSDRGGDPMETSQQHDQEGDVGSGAELRPSDVQNRAFIFDQHSDETTQKDQLRPSDAHHRIGAGHSLQPPGSESLPQSLKDSEESISAVRNLSRYEDMSATIHASPHDRNISHERHPHYNQQQLNHQAPGPPRPSHLLPQRRVPKLQLTIKSNDKSTHTIQQEANEGDLVSTNHHGAGTSSSLVGGGGTRVNLFETGRRADRDTLVPYSFADGLHLRQARNAEGVDDELKQSGSRHQMTLGGTSSSNVVKIGDTGVNANGGSQQHVARNGNLHAGVSQHSDYMLSAPGAGLYGADQKSSSITERVTNPFLVDEAAAAHGAAGSDHDHPSGADYLNIVVDKTAGNRQTSYFGTLPQSQNGSSQGQNRSQYLIVRPQTDNRHIPGSHRTYQSQDQDQQSTPNHRVLTTDAPYSEFTKPLDSARNRLLSSQGDDDPLMLLGSNQSSMHYNLHKANQQSLNSQQRLNSVKYNSQNTLQISFIEEHNRRLSLDSHRQRKMDMAKRKRKVSFRLTQRQVGLLSERYTRWRSSLSFYQKCIQQQSSHKLFIPTFSKAQIFLSVLTLTFSFLGFLFYFSADKLNSEVIDYGTLCEGQPRQCVLPFVPSHDLENPHLYYELDSFYSNQRIVTTTMTLFNQLLGEPIKTPNLSVMGLTRDDACQGVSTVGDLLKDHSVYKGFATEDLDSTPTDSELSPCGILPKYVFTDSFKLWLKSDSSVEQQPVTVSEVMSDARLDQLDEIPIDETNISRKYDRERRFKRAGDTQQWLDVTNEHFIVWMQMDTLNQVYRLYGRVDEVLKKDETYTLTIDNSYDAAGIFGGSKRLHLQEVNQLGGSNKFLGVLLIFAAICLVLIQLAFLFLYVVKIANRPGGAGDFYDPDNTSW